MTHLNIFGIALITGKGSSGCRWREGTMSIGLPEEFKKVENLLSALARGREVQALGLG